MSANEPAELSEPSPNLAEAIARCGERLPLNDVPLSAEQIEALERYCRLLWEWNERLNLTRHTDFDKFAARDLADTLELARLIEPGERVLDIGSGGGVPGIPLAIARPDLAVTLCESVAKKARALEDIVAKLGLPIAVASARAEEILEIQPFDVVTARAVGPLIKILAWLKPHWPAAGRLLAIKGPKWVDERKEARHRGLMRGLEMRKAAEYEIAGTKSTGVILKIWPEA
jgi:16S rRNA (guanine527-N7)-methyltransferase